LQVSGARLSVGNKLKPIETNESNENFQNTFAQSINYFIMFCFSHNVEPGAVNLSYREGGSSAGLISMSVGSETERGVETIPMDTEQPTRFDRL